jgi:hypothetical protein
MGTAGRGGQHQPGSGSSAAGSARSHGGVPGLRSPGVCPTTTHALRRGIHCVAHYPRIDVSRETASPPGSIANIERADCTATIRDAEPPQLPWWDESPGNRQGHVPQWLVPSASNRFPGLVKTAASIACRRRVRFRPVGATGPRDLVVTRWGRMPCRRRASEHPHHSSPGPTGGALKCFT